MLKRSLSLLLALLMLFPLLAACGNREKAIDILEDGYSDYVIVCPSGKDDDSKAENKTALALFEAIKKDLGVSLKCVNDSAGGEEQPETAAEILVGATNRRESQKYLEGLRLKDYVITYENDRVVILGGSPEATAEAVEYFIEKYINKTEKKITVYKNRNDTVLYPYAVGKLSVNGVPLSDYTIVYPEDADKATDAELCAYYTALALADYLELNAGIRLSVVDDDTAEADYEILVGETERAASQEASKKALQKDQYILMSKGTKLIMLGNSYMVGGAASALVNLHFASQGVNVDINTTDIPTTPTPKAFTFEKATSAILMIGDGMGDNHINATLDSGKLESFIARDLPHQSFCTTASQSVIDGKKGYTDSAAAATALATGYKTLNGYLGMDENKVVRENVRELAHDAGANTGVLTTDAITGATPSGFLGHHKDRNATSTLQKQINTLIEEEKIDYCKGSVSNLATPARAALNSLSADGADFFMMIEEAHIDKRSHEGDTSMSRMQDCVVRYNQCIAYVVAFVMLHPNTALIITADHETGGLTKQPDGSYVFENETSTDYWQHTNNNAPIFALGEGVDALVRSGTITDNTLVAKHIAGIFGDTNFGE